jgi:hypothetical protein
MDALQVAANGNWCFYDKKVVATGLIHGLAHQRISEFRLPALDVFVLIVEDSFQLFASLPELFPSCAPSEGGSNQLASRSAYLATYKQVKDWVRFPLKPYSCLSFPIIIPFSIPNLSERSCWPACQLLQLN